MHKLTILREKITCPVSAGGNQSSLLEAKFSGLAPKEAKFGRQSPMEAKTSGLVYTL